MIFSSVSVVVSTAVLVVLPLAGVVDLDNLFGGDDADTDVCGGSTTGDEDEDDNDDIGNCGNTCKTCPDCKSNRIGFPVSLPTKI